MEETFVEEKGTGSSFDFKRFLSKLVSNYYWFLLTIVLFGTAAYLYLRYTQPLYEVSTWILIKQPNDITTIGGSAFSPSDKGSTTLVNFSDPLNEMFKLKSEAIIGEVVDSLNLDMNIEKIGKVKNKPIGMESLPFDISFRKSSRQNRLPVLTLVLSQGGYTLKSEKTNIKGYYDRPLIINEDTLLISLKPFENPDFSAEYSFTSSRHSSAVSKISSRITVAPAAKAGPGMLQISVRDELPRRAKKIIDVLINRYDQANLEFKNKSLRMEIDFLKDRVTAVSNELLRKENQVRDFKITNKVTDVSASANQLLGSLTNIDAKKSDIENKKYLADVVEASVKNVSGQEQVISNTSGLGDAVVSNLVSKYNDLVLKKNNILDQGTVLHPRLPEINQELQALRTNILNSIANLRKELQANKDFLEAQERSTTGRFQSMPEKEKDYVQVNRLLALKESMYLFLLERMEDKQIQLVTSQIGESRIIDSRTGNSILYPKPTIIYGVAILLSILLPSMIILLRMMLNKKIETRKDIESATTLPIAGEIEMEPRTAKEIIVSAGYRSDIAEQFRTLRTNLIYLKQETPGKVLMITSSITGEGKSFVSLNLANTLSLTGKKVVLVEFDLRKPQLAKRLNLKTRPGLTDYLITADMHVKDTVQNHPDYENLSFITCGPIPPNPGELILHKRMQNLFEYLRNNYDYIVVDTPPVGIISDAIIIANWVDLTLFVIRHQFSYRSSLQLLNELNENKKLPRLSVVINSIKRNKGFSKEMRDTYKYYQQEIEGKKSKKVVV